MNTERLNEIYNKFPKTELEKVELALVDGFKSDYNKLQKESNKIFDKFAKIEDQKNDLITDINYLQQQYDTLWDRYDKIDEKADELGISVKEILGFVPEFDADINELTDVKQLLK